MEFLGLFGVFVVFKWFKGPWVGDIGCAVFIVESTNPKNLDLNKNLNLIIIDIERSCSMITNKNQLLIPAPELAKPGLTCTNYCLRCIDMV